MAIRDRLKLCASALLLAAGASVFNGCAAPSNDLTLSSTETQRDFTQTFPKAFATTNSNGDYDVVMVRDANADAVADTGGPVRPGPLTPRQVVHVRVFWNPVQGTRADHPAATNAAIHWYLFCDRPNECPRCVEYSGSGLVWVSGDDQTATVTIKGAFMKPVHCDRSMADPMGPSSLSGTVTAQVDRKQVNQLLAEVKSATEGPAQATADATR